MNEELAEELHKPVIKKFQRRKVYESIRDLIAGIETQPVSVKVKIRKHSIKFKYLHVFGCFSLIKSLCFIFF